MKFRALKTRFLAIFLIELIFIILSPFLALAREQGLNVDKEGIQGFLAKIIGFLEGLWWLAVNNWGKLASSLEQFLDQTFWPKIRQGGAYLENEFYYRKSIFFAELKKEIEEITLDAFRLINIIKK